MKTIHRALASAAVCGLLALNAATAAAAPTETPAGGNTSVQLAPSFLAALTSLKVTPAAIAPGKIVSRSKGVFASFPITTGEIDVGTLKAEIDHAGGLSLTAGGAHVQLTAFVIDLTGTTPVLTGLVTVNGSLLGRFPLFDLDLAHSSVSAKDELVKVSNVAVTLTDAAAGALNGVFNITALSQGLAIGSATVRAHLEGKEGSE
jgi:hypothetical protein